MMSGLIAWFTQVAAVTRFNLLTLPQRVGSSVSAIFGITGVVAVMVGVLSIAQGILHTMQSSASPLNAIVLRSGANTEMMSGLDGESVKIIAQAPGVARNENGALASPELFVIINLPKRSTGTDANVPLRGVRENATAVRDSFRITSGRMFGWGTNEVMVGRGASLEFSGLELGSTVQVGSENWPVVGIFEAAGGIAESEIWVDRPCCNRPSGAETPTRRYMQNLNPATLSPPSKMP